MNKELKDLKILIEHVDNLEDEAEKVEAYLKKLKERIDQFRTDVIPEFMFSMGLSEVKLDDGREVGIVTKYYGNISEERAEAAFKWLREHEHASLIKTNLAMSFTSGMEDKVDLKVLQDFLKEKEIAHVEKEAVHPQTLKSFIKQSMEAGINFPYELFGVYVSKDVSVGK